MAATTEVKLAEALRCLVDPPLGSVRYRVIHGGRGGGKSWGIARVLLSMAATQPLRVLCAREYQASIRASVHTLLSDQITRLGMESVYRVESTRIRGLNGSEFLFAGVRRDPHSLKSMEGVDVCWIEEAEAISLDSWRILVPTIRRGGSEIWISYNPTAPEDVMWQEFLAGRERDDAIVQRVTWADNPWLPSVLRHEREELLRRDPEAEAHIWGGEPWQRSDHMVMAGAWTVDDVSPDETWDGPYYGADWGFARDPTVLVRCWIAGSRLVIDYDERGIEWSLDDIERHFLRVPGSREHVIRADSARPEIISELARRGWRIEAAAKWSGSVEDGISHLRGYDAVVIHPRCKGLIQEARLWRYKRDARTGDVLPSLVPGHEHGWDSCRYALAPMIRKLSEVRLLA